MTVAFCKKWVFQERTFPKTRRGFIILTLKNALKNVYKFKKNIYYYTNSFSLCTQNKYLVKCFTQTQILRRFCFHVQINTGSFNKLDD